MRKGIIIIFIFLSALGLKAQFSVGVRGGFGNHGIFLEPPGLRKYQSSLYLPNAGLVIIYNNDNNAGLQMEINYAQKGWHEMDSATNTHEYYMQLGDTLSEHPYFKRTITYLEVPFYSHWEMGYGKVRPIIFAGPYLGWKLSEKIETSHFDHIWNPEHPYLHYEQDIRNLDFGIKIGLGLRYNISKRLGVYADVRYDLEMAGGRDIFFDRPNGIQASRLTEISGTFGILWHIIPQKEKKTVDGYTPKENLFEEF